MAIDTAQKRASATLMFPQVQTIYPAGSVDRETAAWVYGGIAAGSVIIVAELWDMVSELLNTLSANSDVMPTLDNYSELLPTLSRDSLVGAGVVADSTVDRTLVGVSTI